MKKVNEHHRLVKIGRLNARDKNYNYINQNEIKNQKNYRYKLLNKIIEIIEEKKK